MKFVLTSVLALIMVIPAISQDDPYGQPVMSKKEERQFVKEKKLAERLAEEAKMKAITSQILKSQRFVLEADYLSDRTGARQSVSSMLNFILLDSLQGTLQVGNQWGLGYNGVGGVTVEGDISKYEISEKQTKRGTSYTITYYLNTAMGNYDVQMWVTSTGNAEASVRGNFSGSITYSGRIKPLKASKVYKGNSF